MTFPASPLQSGVESAARCSEHVDAVAVATCGRCGRFACEACLRGTLCIACNVQALASLPSASRRARRASALLWTVAGGAVVLALGDLASGPLGLGPANPLIGVIDVVGGLATALGFIGSVITFLMWEHLAVRYAQGLGHSLDVTPGWAVGYWFIPFVNLVRPYRIMRALLIAFGGSEAETSAPLNAWWGLWIVSNIVSNIDTRLDSAGHGVATISLISNALTVAAAVFAVRVVKAVQAALDARLASGG